MRSVVISDDRTQCCVRRAGAERGVRCGLRRNWGLTMPRSIAGLTGPGRRVKLNDRSGTFWDNFCATGMTRILGRSPTSKSSRPRAGWTCTAQRAPPRHHGRASRGPLRTRRGGNLRLDDRSPERPYRRLGATQASAPAPRPGPTVQVQRRSAWATTPRGRPMKAATMNRPICTGCGLMLADLKMPRRTRGGRRHPGAEADGGSVTAG